MTLNHIATEGVENLASTDSTNSEHLEAQPILEGVLQDGTSDDRYSVCGITDLLPEGFPAALVQPGTTTFKIACPSDSFNNRGGGPLANLRVELDVWGSVKGAGAAATQLDATIQVQDIEVRQTN
ncbi:MAG TPA: hypothetical protein VFK89_02795 [Actinomycetota bacterium]|nr:hypothetical protein [Actinomycetota bacterium]